MKLSVLCFRVTNVWHARVLCLVASYWEGAPLMQDILKPKLGAFVD